MNKRFLAAVILCSTIPLLAAAAVIYHTSVSKVRRDIEGALILEAEYKSKEIHGYLSLKKQTQAILSGLGMFSVAVEYQRFEGLTRFFDAMMKNEKGYASICFLDRNLKIQAVNERSSDGKYLGSNHVAMARYVAGVDFKSIKPWQFVSVGGVLTPVLVSRVSSDSGECIGYLLVVLNRGEFEALLSSFAEKYKRLIGVSLEYLAAVKVGETYLPLVMSGDFEYFESLQSAERSGISESRGELSVWNTYGDADGVRTYFQAPGKVLFSRLRTLRDVYLAVIPLFMLAIGALIVYITKYSFRSIEVLLEKMEDMSKGNYSRIGHPDFSGDKYINYANQLIDRILSYEEAYRKDVQLSALGTLASQVAHDIRSPLAALDSLAKDLGHLPEEKRIIVRSSIARIRDIANDLIEKNRQLPREAGAVPVPRAAEPVSVQLLSSVIESVVTEKRLQYRSKIGVEIDARLENDSYGLFARIQLGEFKRALSNIMNNAVEALDKSGSVILSMGHADRRVIITVKDSGKGISPEILGRLGSRGETHGKPGGSGLGLYHAKMTVESWGGSLDVQSALGKGTAVSISLERAQSPEWFLADLSIRPGTTVVVLDDDTSIHQVWQGRFDSLRAGDKQVVLMHFSTPAEIRTWSKANPDQSAAAYYMLDYELLGYPETGLSLAEELLLGSRAVLVTSRYEEGHILEKCLRLNVKLMPKGLAGHIPIEIKEVSAASVAAILLDDDALVRMTWKTAAKGKRISLRAFSLPEDLFSAEAEILKDTAIYIDSDLGNGIKGEDIAKTLRDKGFSNICLETGHEPEKFTALPWLKVIGKEPPWS